MLVGFALACQSPDPAIALSPVAGPDEVVMDDTAAGLTVRVEGGGATGWRFGAFEPRVDLYEEACRDDDDLCHTLERDGGTLDWAAHCGENADGSTCIAQLYWRQGEMSFVIRPSAGPGCWAWGEDADYYTGCVTTDWARDSY